MEARPRPSVGDVTIIEKRHNVCRACGYVIDDLDDCAYECDQDGAPLDQREYVVAVYKVTSEFLGDVRP